jgi:hypothetical protein
MKDEVLNLEFKHMGHQSGKIQLRNVLMNEISLAVVRGVKPLGDTKGVGRSVYNCHGKNKQVELYLLMLTEIQERRFYIIYIPQH